MKTTIHERKGRGSPRGLAGAVVFALLAAVPGPLRAAPAPLQDPIRVVTTLPTYADIARRVAGEHASVEAIARGDQDPHFVNPRPSFARMIQRADLFVTTGLDLELWVPGLLDRSGNPDVVEGADGHVAAYSGIELLDVPASPSRSEGDVHVFGNPHIHTDPINAILVARNIAAGLRRVDPEHSAAFANNLEAFEDEVLRRLFGDRLVEMLGRETLFGLARGRQFWKFAEGREFEGQPLTAYVGGWMARAAPFRGESMACYHKNWAYFSARFRVDCAIYVEPKVGIPPTPGHVRKVIAFIRENSIPALLAATYFDRGQIQRVAERTGARAVSVPEHVGGAEGVDDYFELIDLWVRELAAAFDGTTAAGE